MEIRQLRYFLKLAKLGGFSRASQALHIAQPALSYQIGQLEGELGHLLLHRRHNGVRTTPAFLNRRHPQIPLIRIFRANFSAA